MQIWLTIFVSWPAPTDPISGGGAGVAVDQLAGTLKRAGLATDHDGQLAVFRSCLTTGDRGVEKSYASVGTGGREFPGDPCGRCRVIDQNGARLHAGQRTRLSGDDAPQVIIVADAYEDRLGAFDRRRGRQSRFAAMLAGPGVGPWSGFGCRPRRRGRLRREWPAMG